MAFNYYSTVKFYSYTNNRVFEVREILCCIGSSSTPYILIANDNNGVKSLMFSDGGSDWQKFYFGNLNVSLSYTFTWPRADFGGPKMDGDLYVLEWEMEENEVVVESGVESVGSQQFDSYSTPYNIYQAWANLTQKSNFPHAIGISDGGCAAEEFMDITSLKSVLKNW